MFEVARFEKRPQLVRHEEDAPVAILRCLWIEPDFSCFEIDLAPLKREHLRGNSPTRDVRELDNGLQSLWQVGQNAVKHVQVEESLSGVPFLQHGNVRPV